MDFLTIKDNFICIILYMISAVLFIMGIKKLGKADTARKGNLYSSVGMAVAVISVLISQDVIDGGLVGYGIIACAVIAGSIVGFIWAKKVEMTGMPQLVALFNGFGGLSSMLVAISQYCALRGGSDRINTDAFTSITLGLTVVIGAIINFGIQVPNMYKTGFRYSPALDFKNDGVRQFFRLLGPVLIGTSVMEINLMVNQYFASGIGSSVITLMKQSQTIMLLPVRIFGASIALSIFPTLSGYYATGHMDNYVKDFSKCLRTVLFIVIPIIGMFITLRVPLVRAMYRQGSFTEEMVQDMAYLLMFYSVGIVAYSVREVMIRGFYAVKDTKTPVKINVFILSLNCVLSALFVRPLGVIGLVFAYLIAGFVSMSLLTYFLRKKLGGLQGRKVVQSAIKIIISSAVMMVVLVVFRISIEHFADVTSKLQQLIELMLLGIVGVGIYMLMSYLLKTEEMENAIDMLRSKFGRLLKFKKKRQES